MKRSRSANASGNAAERSSQRARVSDAAQTRSLLAAWHTLRVALAHARGQREQTEIARRIRAIAHALSTRR